MGKNSIKKNFFYNMFFEVLKIILPLITTPYISRVLGAENIGIYSYVISISTYFILFGSLGIASYGQREIAYLQNDKSKRSKLFLEILIVRFITLLVSLIIFYVAFCKNGNYAFYYKVLILEIVSQMLDISFYFQALEEFKKIVIRNSLVKICSVIAIFLLVKNPNDLSIYLGIYVLSTFFGNLTMWLYVPKYVSKVNIRKLEILKHIKPTISLFIPQIAIQLYTVLDKVMIGTIISDKSEVGFYEQSQKIIKLLLTIVTALGTVMVPRMASVFANGDTKKLKEYMSKSFRFMMFISIPMIFGMISIVSKFVPIFYGPGYDKVIYLIIIMCPILFIIGLSNVIGVQYLVPTKQQNKLTISVISGAIVNFLLNLILIRYYKSIGASIATLIAESVVTTVQFYLVRKQIKFIPVLQNSVKYLISAILMFIVSLIFGIIIKNNMISIIIQIISGGSVYILVLLLLKEEFLLNFINNIKNKFLKEKVN